MILSFLNLKKKTETKKTEKILRIYLMTWKFNVA